MTMTRVPLAVLFTLLCFFIGSSVADKPPANCEQPMFHYCNTDENCVNAMKSHNYALPLYPLYDYAGGNGVDVPASKADAKEWRCYSPSSLSADNSTYASGTAYCSRNEQLEQVLAECQTNRSMVQVFGPGMLGYPCIRIPSILLAGDNKTLLAFAECRNWTGDGCEPQAWNRSPVDNSNRDLCMRRSTDGGSTWDALRVIARNAAQPTPVWDTDRNRLVMNYVQLSPGKNLQMYSNDMGTTWSDPMDLGKFLGSAVVSDVGPGVGIQLKVDSKYRGRLLFIGHHGAYEYDSVWYSDDGGQTYKMSKTNFTHMDEAQLVELPDGRVMANMRNNHLTSCNCRGVAVSDDGGASFSPVSFDSTLIEPVCMASIIRSQQNGKVYFANPATTSSRTNGTVRVSDDGQHWTSSLVVWPGDYAYSCLTDVPQTKHIGLLWETNSDGCSGASCQSVFSLLPADF